jgi:hypothetical protein
VTRWSRLAAIALAVAGVLTIVLARTPSSDPATDRPIGCEFAVTAVIFCPALPSFAPPVAGPVRVADQVRPCEDADTFRPSFCVALPGGVAASDRAALVAQRQNGCAQLSAGDSPGFCLVIPSGATADATLQREVGLVLLRERLGPDFRRIGADGLDLWAESGVSDAAAARVETVVREDAAFIESYFARKLRDMPALFVFSSQPSFAFALEKQFGYSRGMAAQLSNQYGGLLVSGLGAIVINGQNILGETRPTIFRHELTHVMVHQLAGTGLPTWLDEGLATLVAENDSSVFDLDRVTALSILADDSLRLLAFDEDRSWFDRNTALSGNAYGVAAEAARSIAQRIDRVGLAAMLEAIGRGKTVSEAYQDATGESLTQFVRSLAERVLAGCAKGLVLSAPRPDGLVVWRIYGFGPSRSVSVTADGPAHYAFLVITDRYGVHSGTLGGPMPAGTYALRALLGTTGGVTISVAVGSTSASADRACGA